MISEARIAAFNIPLLGETLIEMGLIRKEQLEEALMNQDGAVNVYRSLKSEKLAAAIEIGFILNSTLSIPEILGKILRQVNRVVHAVASTLMLIDVKTGELVFSVPTGPKSDKLVDIRIPPGKGIAGKQETTLEIDSVRKDGRTVPYELKAALIRKNDKIVAVQTILRNIYERKQMEGKLV